MNFIGLDLAWSTGRTGLCLTRDGRVADSGVAETDDEIVAWLAPHVNGACLVAVDAPVIVANAEGQRPCEHQISSTFGRYWAGAHTTNLKKFPQGTRALRLAHRLALLVDPVFTRGEHVRRLIEVYPHPALVALFDLPQRLPHKAGGGRTLAERQQAFVCLLDLLETLVNTDPPLNVHIAPRWPMLRERVVSTAVGTELDRLEDEVDAYVCAYIGLFHWTHGAPRSRIFGDLETGYIVVPVAGAAKGSPLHEAAAHLTTVHV